MDEPPLLMQRDSRFIDVALEESEYSNAPNFKIGAVIAKGRKIIGVGSNDIIKTHPRSTTMGQHIHAELSAILNSDRESLIGATIYVARKSSRNLLARPCNHCFALLKKVGVKRIVYTVENGVAEEIVS